MINQDYLCTKIYTDVNDLTLEPNSIFLYSISAEERSSYHVEYIKLKYSSIKFIEIEIIENERDLIIEKHSHSKINLRSEYDIQTFIISHNITNIYIDATGLNTRVLASLLRNAVIINKKQKLEIFIVYVEPYSYNISKFKLEGVYNDLSEKIEGIDPLPGFANFIPYTDDIKLVALLGFEGGRFAYIKNTIQPPDDRIIPIIGVPGYRIEYPFVALSGNYVTLNETKSWNELLYISANSIVDSFTILKKILKETPEYLKLLIAPIGTKPHTIGALLFAIEFPKRVEIVYDNPKRKINRTDGTGQFVVCNVNLLLSDNKP